MELLIILQRTDYIQWIYKTMEIIMLWDRHSEKSLKSTFINLIEGALHPAYVLRSTLSKEPKINLYITWGVPSLWLISKVDYNHWLKSCCNTKRYKFGTFGTNVCYIFVNNFTIFSYIPTIPWFWRPGVENKKKTQPTYSSVLLIWMWIQGHLYINIATQQSSHFPHFYSFNVLVLSLSEVRKFMP